MHQKGVGLGGAVVCKVLKLFVCDWFTRNLKLSGGWGGVVVRC